MPTDWIKRSVLDLQDEGVLLVEDGNHGEYRPRRNEFTNEGHAFIRAADMDAGQVLFNSAQRINKTALERIRKGLGKPGDVLFSHKGTVGKLALVPDDSPPFVCSPQTTFWRSLNERRLDRRFLYYYMQSHDFRSQWSACKGETDMADYVSLTAQRAFEVLLPKPEEQQAIAAVLGSLDDKIEQNRRTAAKLEELARATFRAWFVDFAPVHAKAAGAASYPGLPPEAFAALPTELEDSPLGRIPKGWECKAIGDVISIKGGATPSTKNASYWESGEHAWATPKDLSHLTLPVLLDTSRKITEAGVEKISSGMLQAGTVLMSSRAPVGYLAIAAIPTAINQGFIAMACDGPLPNVYVLRWAEHSMDMIKGNASGTTFAEISKRNFRPLPIVVPQKAVVEAFEQYAMPMHDLLVASERESCHLADLRDYLLPRLLSGKVRVR